MKESEDTQGNVVCDRLGEAMKDVLDLRISLVDPVKVALIRGFPNGANPLYSRYRVSFLGAELREVKHLST